jgi:hypothetical protein
VDIYVAVADYPCQDRYTPSAIFGAFSTEERARAAVEEDAGPLEWKEDRATDAAGVNFTVMLVSLDEAI